jgi:hypothetical protein
MEAGVAFVMITRRWRKAVGAISYYIVARPWALGTRLARGVSATLGPRFKRQPFVRVAPRRLSAKLSSALRAWGRLGGIGGRSWGGLTGFVATNAPLKLGLDVMTTARFQKVSIALAVLTSVGAAGCGMGSLTSGIGGGLFGGGAAGKADQGSSSITTESLLQAAKSDGNAGGDVAGGCPKFVVFSRDSNVTIYEPGRVGDALGVVHRGEITKTARECSVENGRVTVKYGFSGRILLGPKGKTGNVTLPLAVFVTDGKKERVANDRMRVDVPVALDKPIGYFSTVREVSFPLPEGARPGEFEVFVGFERNIPNAG